MRLKLPNSKPLKNSLAWLCGQPLAWVRRSWRVESVTFHPKAEGLIKAGTPVIYALWHGRMYCLFKAVPLDKTAILVSPSNDGEFITRLARTIGFRNFVRGSHKRGGLHAVLSLRKALVEDRLPVAFTVDGPRGPRYEVKPGIIRLASLSGAPIIPLGSATRHLLFKLTNAWDHYHGPIPGTSMRLIYGEPLNVPPNATDEEIEAAAKSLETELMRVNLEADAAYGFRNQERL